MFSAHLIVFFFMWVYSMSICQVKMQRVEFEFWAASTSACNQKFSSVDREPVQQWAHGDDHNACGDEFSSCGQLDTSTERERESERARVKVDEGFNKMGMEKRTLKQKQCIGI